MADIFSVIQDVAWYANLMLADSLVLSRYSNRNIEQKYGNGKGTTVDAVIPPDITASRWDGTGTIPVITVTETKVPVVIDEYITVRRQLSDTQRKLNITDFMKQVVEPSMKGIIKTLEVYSSEKLGLFADNMVGTAGNEITKLANVTAASKQVYVTSENDENELVQICTPDSFENLSNLDSFNSVDYNPNAPASFQRGIIGKSKRILTHQSVRCGTLDTTDTAGTVLAFGGAASGATTMATDGYTAATGTVHIGTSFTVTGSSLRHTVSAKGTLASNAVTLTFIPALDGTVADNAPVTFETAFKQNFVYNPEAYALAILPAAPDHNVASATYQGIGMSIVTSDTLTTNLSKEIVFVINVGGKVIDSRHGCINNG